MPKAADSITPEARDRILREFDRLRVWQQGDKRAVHKPLLVLLALGRLARNEPSLVEFAEVDHTLQDLLRQFGPPSAPATRHYPFWHLATDKIWQLKGPPEILSRPRGSAPTLKELRTHHVAGTFSDKVLRALKSDPTLVAEIARRILAAHFPETLHPDVLAAVGLTLEDAVGRFRQEKLARTASRDPAFREHVLRAYEYRCCVCGYDIRLGHQYAGLEAAHIKWVQANGPDTIVNGLALCSLHHKIFDLGAFTVLPENYVLAFSQAVAGSPDMTARLLSYHGAAIIPPQSKSYLPKAEFLRWHRKEVFKGEPRDL